MYAKHPYYVQPPMGPDLWTKAVGAGVAVIFLKAGKQSSLFAWQPQSLYNLLLNCGASFCVNQGIYWGYSQEHG